VSTDAGYEHLKGLLEEHAQRTGSEKAASILGDWENTKGTFWQLVPPSEKDAPMVNPEVPQTVPLPAYYLDAQLVPA
jgi:glutamate synthase (ferredoxin)